MKHASSLALYDYWNRLRGERLAPERSELNPAAIRGVLGDVVILEVGGPERYFIRLAGTRICALMGRELKDRAFAEPFAPADWRELYSLMDSVVVDSAPTVASVIGETKDGRMMGMELLLLPLRHHGRTQARLMGSLSALARPYWSTLEPLACLRLHSSRVVRHEDLVAQAQAIIPHVPKPVRTPPQLRLVTGGRV